jgi:hypothetical protein
MVIPNSDPFARTEAPEASTTRAGCTGRAIRVPYRRVNPGPQRTATVNLAGAEEIEEDGIGGYRSLRRRDRDRSHLLAVRIHPNHRAPSRAYRDLS